MHSAARSPALRKPWTHRTHRSPRQPQVCGSWILPRMREPWVPRAHLEIRLCMYASRFAALCAGRTWPPATGSAQTLRKRAKGGGKPLQHTARQRPRLLGFTALAQAEMFTFAALAAMAYSVPEPVNATRTYDTSYQATRALEVRSTAHHAHSTPNRHPPLPVCDPSRAGSHVIDCKAAPHPRPPLAQRFCFCFCSSRISRTRPTVPSTPSRAGAASRAQKPTPLSRPRLSRARRRACTRCELPAGQESHLCSAMARGARDLHGDPLQRRRPPIHMCSRPPFRSHPHTLAVSAREATATSSSRSEARPIWPIGS